MVTKSLDSLGILSIILFTSFPIFIIFFLNKLIKHKIPPLPPGPTPWPIIGTILKLNPQTLTNLARTYGPLMHIKLGSRHVIVGSTTAAAAAILKDNDRALSGRGAPAALPKTPAQTDKLSFWADSTSPHWRALRTVCRGELFGASALERSTRVREEKATELVAELRSRGGGGVVDVEKMVYDTVVNISSNVYFSKDVCVGFGENCIWEIMKGIGEVFSSFNLADLYPILGVFDLQGLKAKYRECSMKMWGVWDPLLKERRRRKNVDQELKHHDFLDTLISKRFEDDQINHLLEDLFTGGIHTTTSTIIKTMMELLKSPQLLAKLQQELDAAFNGRDSFSSLITDDLLFLQACIKETLRLHPPAPLALNHRAYEACHLMSYFVPKNALVVINLGAIGRDPAVWETPLQYRPERFLGPSLDFKGNDFEFIPFGAGRRICPGMNMATKIVALVVASLVYFFDWSAPEEIGVPLLLVPKARK